MMVRCYWCISILIIIPTIRCCSLTGPFSGWSAVVLSDRRFPSFWNFDSAISIDVIRMKSYMDSLFDPTCVQVRVTINKLNFFPNRKMPRFVSVFRNASNGCAVRFHKGPVRQNYRDNFRFRLLAMPRVCRLRVSCKCRLVLNLYRGGL